MTLLPALHCLQYTVKNKEFLELLLSTIYSLMRVTPWWELLLLANLIHGMCSLFLVIYFLKTENKHQIINVHTKWNCLIPILQLPSINCFRPENVSYKWPMCIGGKITTVPRLFLEHLLQNENKHQITNVHTKWNRLIHILPTLVKH